MDEADTQAVERIAAMIHPGHIRNNMLGVYWYHRSRGVSIEQAGQHARERMAAKAPEKPVARRKGR